MYRREELEAHSSAAGGAAAASAGASSAAERHIAGHEAAEQKFVKVCVYICL